MPEALGDVIDLEAHRVRIVPRRLHADRLSSPRESGVPRAPGDPASRENRARTVPPGRRSGDPQAPADRAHDLGDDGRRERHDRDDRPVVGLERRRVERLGEWRHVRDRDLDREDAEQAGEEQERVPPEPVERDRQAPVRVGPDDLGDDQVV